MADSELQNGTNDTGFSDSMAPYLIPPFSRTPFPGPGVYVECNLLNALDVLHRVGFSAAHWKELGRRLVPTAIDTEAIAVNNRRVQDCLEAVVALWLRDGEGVAGWEGLAGAVARCRGGGGRNVAQNIREITREREANG